MCVRLQSLCVTAFASQMRPGPGERAHLASRRGKWPVSCRQALLPSRVGAALARVLFTVRLPRAHTRFAAWLGMRHYGPQQAQVSTYLTKALEHMRLMRAQLCLCKWPEKAHRPAPAASFAVLPETM